jgi:hypothetical protein
MTGLRRGFLEVLEKTTKIFTVAINKRKFDVNFVVLSKLRSC